MHSSEIFQNLKTMQIVVCLSFDDDAQGDDSRNFHSLISVKLSKTYHLMTPNFEFENLNFQTLLAKTLFETNTKDV